MPSRRRHREAARSAPATPAPATPGTDARPRVASAVTRVADVSGVVALGHHLLDADRLRPVVVVTVPSGRGEPYIDAEAVARAVGDLAEVVVVPTEHVGWRLSAVLPRLTAVYGGAGRVYPVGTEWHHAPGRAPLRFAYSEEEGEAAAEALISDALRLAEDAGLVRQAAGEPAGGEVLRVLPPSRAVVRLDEGGTATVWSELTVPGVPVDRLLRTGQRVTGVLTGDRLDVTAMLADREAFSPEPGDVVLARVVAVRPDVVHLALLPDEVVAVPRDRATSAPDALADLFSVGEVVVARVAWLGPGDRPALRLDDVGPEVAPGAVPAILPGGPPWLAVPAHTGEDEDAADGGEPGGVGPERRDTPDAGGDEAGRGQERRARPPKGATASMALALEAARALARAEADRADRAEADLAEARRTVRELTELARSLQEDRGRLQGQVQAQRTQLRLRATDRRREPGTVVAPPEVVAGFTDPEEQFRHEVYVAWVETVPAGEKAQRPLPQYRVGPDFLASLESEGSGLRAKVVRVVVEVLTGLAESLDGREVHRLRLGPGGDDPVVVRDDGAVCWRAAVQRNTPAARRLHYWKLGDVVELSRVTLHDDFRP